MDVVMIWGEDGIGKRRYHLPPLAHSISLVHSNSSFPFLQPPVFIRIEMSNTLSQEYNYNMETFMIFGIERMIPFP